MITKYLLRARPYYVRGMIPDVTLGSAWLPILVFLQYKDLPALHGAFFAGGSAGKESSCQCRRHKRCGFDPWVRKIPWSRKWQPIPVFLPGKFHIHRGLGNYSPWGHKESDMTEHTTGISGIKWLKHTTKLENHHARDVHFIDSLCLHPSHAPIVQHLHCHGPRSVSIYGKGFLSQEDRWIIKTRLW